MSDLELHTKALDLLVQYSESEQYDPCLDATNILISNLMILAELRYTLLHVIRCHDSVGAMIVLDDIRQAIDSINEDDKNLRAVVHDKDLEG